LLRLRRGAKGVIDRDLARQQRDQLHLRAQLEVQVEQLIRLMTTQV
jgi:hypothetical protein